MKLSELVKSKEFLDAKAKVQGWKVRLEKAGSNEALRVRDEKSAFFGGLKAARPDLYAAFQMEDKTLSEAIFKKLTGKDVIID
ncbi:hypothetical protein L0Y65_01920 [Candidatus Micrarchaeota archaeon]|nr:hypothetical protein [Candidatus Micrarchaeota archaeon]